MYDVYYRKIKMAFKNITHTGILADVGTANLFPLLLLLLLLLTFLLILIFPLYLLRFTSIIKKTNGRYFFIHLLLS